jgi:oligopeptide transport system permease protein
MASAATITAEEYAGGTVAREQVSLWRDGFRRLRRNRMALAASIYLTVLFAIAILAFFYTPYSITHLGVTETYAPISAAHPFGGDELGRDMLSRLMKGAQISLGIGLGSQLIVLLVGVSVGLLAGYARGWIDAIFSLIINVFYGIPDLLVALMLYIILGPGFRNLLIAISVTRWMDMARLVRGQAFSLREKEFIEAARASGSRPGKIIFGHIFPNALGPIIVQATFGIPQAILFEAFLSFLGVGVPPPTPSWGSMASEGLMAIRYTPHIVIVPSIALSLTLLAFNFLGDGLRDAFDPRQKR